jgi:hypothetical protein
LADETSPRRSSSAASAASRTQRFHARKTRSKGPRIQRATRARLASSLVISLSHRICSLFWRTDSCASERRWVSTRTLCCSLSAEAELAPTSNDASAGPGDGDGDAAARDEDEAVAPRHQSSSPPLPPPPPACAGTRDWPGRYAAGR